MPAPSDKPSLTGAERRQLRGLAHHLDPAVRIGKIGLVPTVLDAIDQALAHHELIKIRFLDFKDQKRDLAQTIARSCHCEIVGAVGHIFMFYRQHPEPDKRQIHL